MDMSPLISIQTSAALGAIATGPVVIGGSPMDPQKRRTTTQNSQLFRLRMGPPNTRLLIPGLRHLCGGWCLHAAALGAGCVLDVWHGIGIWCHDHSLRLLANHCLHPDTDRQTLSTADRRVRRQRLPQAPTARQLGAYVADDGDFGVFCGIFASRALHLTLLVL